MIDYNGTIDRDVDIIVELAEIDRGLDGRNMRLRLKLNVEGSTPGCDDTSSNNWERLLGSQS